MTDKDYLMDILEMEKNMVVDMVYAMNEASNDALYKEFFKMFENISKTTKELFTLAYNCNYYNLEQEENNKISKAITKLNNELDK